jgi:outer membrane protein TolC
MLTYVEMLEPIQTRVGPLERSFQLMQAIPFPGKLMAAGSVADEHACIKELEYHIALRDVVADVKIAYAELGYLQQAVAIVHENRQVATLLANKAAAAYGGQGDVTPDGVTLFDTLKAQASLAQLAYDEMTLSEMVRTEEATINALLSRPTALPVGAPLPIRFRPLDVHREVLFQVAAARRQEIQAALHKVQAAHHAERLARLSQVPDINLGLQYSVLGEAINPIPGSGDDALGVSLGISLPLWGPKNQARIAEAQALAWAARDEQRAVTDDVMARITKVFFQLQNAERLSHLYRDSLLPQAEDAVRLAEEWHGAGRDTYGRLLEARTVWFNFQLAAARAVADHEQMVARLEQLVGISLEHFRSEGSAR